MLVLMRGLFPDMTNIMKNGEYWSGVTISRTLKIFFNKC